MGAAKIRRSPAGSAGPGLAQTNADRQALNLALARLEFGCPSFMPPNAARAGRGDPARVRRHDEGPRLLAEADELKIEVDALSGEQVAALAPRRSRARRPVPSPACAPRWRISDMESITTELAPSPEHGRPTRRFLCRRRNRDAGAAAGGRRRRSDRDAAFADAGRATVAIAEARPMAAARTTWWTRTFGEPGRSAPSGCGSGQALGSDDRGDPGTRRRRPRRRRTDHGRTLQASRLRPRQLLRESSRYREGAGHVRHPGARAAVDVDGR